MLGGIARARRWGKKGSSWEGSGWQAGVAYQPKKKTDSIHQIEDLRWSETKASSKKASAAVQCGGARSDIHYEKTLKILKRKGIPS